MSYGKAKQSEASKSDVWQTPGDLRDALVAELGHFVLDVAASESNAVAPVFYTKEQDALVQDWVRPDLDPSGWAFCNPPYSRGNKPKSIKKAKETALGGRGVCCVIPVGMGTKWFHRLILNEMYTDQYVYSVMGENTLDGWYVEGNSSDRKLHIEVAFLEKRFKFVSPLNPDENGATGGTCVVLFQPNYNWRK